MRIDDSVSEISKALKKYCPPKKSEKQDALFRICQKAVKEHVKGSSDGDAYGDVNWSIMLANQHSWRYLKRFIGEGATEYLSSHMDAESRYEEFFPPTDRKKDAGRSRDFVTSYESPLPIQEEMIKLKPEDAEDAEPNVHMVYVETPGGPMTLLEAVEMHWRSFEHDVGSHASLNRVLFEKVRARIDCMGAILAHIEFDSGNPDHFDIRIPDGFPASGTADPSPTGDADRLRGISSKQAEEVARSPRMCLAHASDLKGCYHEVREGIVSGILATVGSGRDVLISGDAGWGKSSALILAYLEMAASESGPVPLLVDTSAMRGFAGGQVASVPLAYGGRVDIGEGDDVVLFIDSVDEHFAPDSIDLAKALAALSPHRLVVAGRTKISRNLKEWTDIDMIEIAPETDAYVSEILDSYAQGDHHELERFLDDAGIRNPMLIAMSARYADPAGGVNVWGIFSQTLERMALERLDGIRQNREEIGTDDVLMILEEYAWADYRDDGAAGDRLDRVSGFLEMDPALVRRAVRSFTDSEGRFLHSLVRDYLVSEWVFRQASRRVTRDDFYDKLLGSDVQRMIGHRLSAEPRGTESLIGWYEAEVSRDRAGGRGDSRKAVAMWYLARVVLSSDPNSNAFRRVHKFFEDSYRTLLDSPECPQMMIVCDTLLQKGHMDVEGVYVDLLEGDAAFARICRNAFMAYAGDIRLQDIQGDYADLTWMGMDRSASMLLRILESKELRHMFQMRADATIAKQLLDSGHPISREALDAIRDLESGSIVDIVERVGSDADFIAALEKYEIDVEEYCDGLWEKLEELVNAAKQRYTDVRTGSSSQDEAATDGPKVL